MIPEPTTNQSGLSPDIDTEQQFLDLHSACTDTLKQRAIALGMTPVPAFFFPIAATNTAATIPANSAKRTATGRAKWQEKGFKQLSLTVPDTVPVRTAFHAIEDQLKGGANSQESLFADTTVLSLKSAHDHLFVEVEALRCKLNETLVELAKANSLLAQKNGATPVGPSARLAPIKRLLAAAGAALFHRFGMQ